jgi:hypothetical protein
MHLGRHPVHNVRLTPSTLRTALAALSLMLAWPGTVWGQTGAATPAPLFPDVLAVQVRPAGRGVFDFDVTVSSPYDTPGRYADGFRVSAPDGRVLGERTLWHDHQHEQPFTRDLHGVRIPPAIQTLTVQARDQLSGYGGRLVTLRLPGR